MKSSVVFCAVPLVAESITNPFLPQIATAKSCTTPAEPLYEAFYTIRLPTDVLHRLFGCIRSVFESRFLSCRATWPKCSDEYVEMCAPSACERSPSPNVVVTKCFPCALGHSRQAVRKKSCPASPGPDKNLVYGTYLPIHMTFAYLRPPASAALVRPKTEMGNGCGNESVKSRDGVSGMAGRQRQRLWRRASWPEQLTLGHRRPRRILDLSTARGLQNGVLVRICGPNSLSNGPVRHIGCAYHVEFERFYTYFS